MIKKENESVCLGLSRIGSVVRNDVETELGVFESTVILL